MSRPKPIVAFELIFFAALALGVLKVWLNWEDFLQSNVSMEINLIYLIGRFIAIGGLVLMVSRNRKKFAIWVLILLISGPIFGKLFLFFKLPSSVIIADLALSIILNSGLQIIAIGLLFAPSSQRWLANKEDVTGLTSTFS